MTLAISIPTATEAALSAKARSMGVDTATYAAQILEAEASRLAAEATQPQPGQRIEDFIGAVAIGGGLDNEQVDAELAREYGDDHA